LTFSVPTTRFAFTDRRMVKVVEPGDVEVWIASHVAASTITPGDEGTTGGAIVSEKQTRSRRLAGSSTARASMAITGDVYPVTTSDPRVVGVHRDAFARVPV
jgi:beta-glucosidase